MKNWISSSFPGEKEDFWIRMVFLSILTAGLFAVAYWLLRKLIDE